MQQNRNSPQTPPTKQSEDQLGVQRIEKREHYIDAHTAAINNATESIILFVSKLHAEDDSADAQKINAAIRRIAIRGIPVQILVGANDDRLSGAIPLSTQENVIVRFDPTVTLSDVSYLCIDSKLVIIGVKRSKQNGYTPSKEWYSIHSFTMVRSLVESFEQKWLSPATLTLEQMLRHHLPAHIKTSGEKAISTQIGLPIEQVRKYKIPHPFVIFLIGRPGSGKTTIANSIKNTLSRADIKAEHITDIDFLYSIFHGDPSDTFRKTSDGGYLVKDQNLYTDATINVTEAIKRVDRSCSFVILELARSNYTETTNILVENDVTPDLIVYIDVDYKTALARNQWRKDVDDQHYVSEEEMKTTYLEDDIRSFEGGKGFNIVRITNPHINRENGNILALNILSKFREVI